MHGISCVLLVRMRHQDAYSQNHILPLWHPQDIWMLRYIEHNATSRKVGSSIPDEVNEFFFLIYLIFPAALGPGVHSASNRNEYQKQKNNVSGEKIAAGA
jgi:hypothetical protein